MTRTIWNDAHYNGRTKHLFALASDVLGWAIGERLMLLRNLLVPIDFSDVSEAALAYGRTLARTFGARLHVLHVMENDFLRPMASNPYMHSEAIGRQVMDKLTDEDRDLLRAVAVLKKSDAPAEDIVKYANAEDIDLIVMGTHGRKGVAHFFVGSVAEHVVRAAPCPVLAVRLPQPRVTADVAVKASVTGA
jgi:nucleotide-binding universal stress UspA family protein